MPNIIAPEPKKKGRPRKPPQAEKNREYNAVSFAGGLSRYGGAETMNDLVRLGSAVDDIDVRMGLDHKLEMARWAWPRACVQTLALGATARTAEVVPAPESSYRGEGDKQRSQDVSEFVRRNLAYLANDSRNIRQTAYLALEWAMIIGNQKAEVVRATHKYGIDAGKSVLSRIKLKSRNTSCFLVDQRGNIEQIGSYLGPLSGYSDPYRSGAMNAAGGIRVADLGANWAALPRDKWLVVTNGGGEEDSPQGESEFRPAYVWWRNARDVLPYWMKMLDFASMPFIWVEGPEMDYCQQAYPLGEDGVPDETADKVDAQVHIFQSVTLGRQGGVAYVPHTTRVNAVHNSSSGDPFAAFMGECNSQIAQAILLQKLATGTDRHQTRAASDVHQDVLATKIRNKRAMVCEAFTRDVFEPLLRDNFPVSHWHLVPSLSFGHVELNDFAAWGHTFAEMKMAGLLVGSQMSYCWDIMGLPQASQEEIKAIMARDEALMASITEPTQNPDGSTGPSILKKDTQIDTARTITRANAKQTLGRMSGARPGA